MKFLNFVINLALDFDSISETQLLFNFAINSLSSESKSKSDSESDFNSFFMNLTFCVFFILYLHCSK